MFIYIKTKYNETELSLLSDPFWLTIKQLKWLIIPIKPHTSEHECKPIIVFTVRPNKHTSLTYTIEKDTNRITVIIKTKEI